MFSPARVANAPPPSSPPPPGLARTALSHRLSPLQQGKQGSPSKQGSPARGPLQPSRAAAAADVKGGGGTYRNEWELYQAEAGFTKQVSNLQRTLKMMGEISKSFRTEWELYVAEARAQEAGPSPIVGDIFEDGMCPGGYHPTHVGERFKDGRYTALYKLGQGHYATVWMVQDRVTGKHAAMKVVRSAPFYTEAARNEIKLLTQISDKDPSGAKHCVRMLDHFEHSGPHGRHVCQVFEAVGDDLLTLLRMYSFRGVPISVVRHLTRQCLEALDFLHTKCQIIHNDLKPENVLLTEAVKPRRGNKEVELPKLEPRLLRMGCKVVDFGCACWTQKKFTEEAQTTQYYRAPEVILGGNYGPASDVWALACMVYELVTGDVLFWPNAGEEYGEDEDHLAQMVELMGPLPQGVATCGRHAIKYFTADGQLRVTRPLDPMSLQQLLQQKHNMPEEEARALCDFLLPMLAYEMDQRATAADSLQHPWLAATATQAQPKPAAAAAKAPAAMPAAAAAAVQPA